MGHGSHSKRRALTKEAARIALVLGILAFAGAVIHFTYLAYSSGQCFTATTDVTTGEPLRRTPVDSGECRQVISRRDDQQRIDATVAMVAIVVLVGGAVRLSKASRRTRRIVLMVEVALVAVGIVYTILLASVLR